MSNKVQADRFNEGKPQWSLVSFKDIEPMVRVLEYGCIKYDAHNWKKGLPVTETLDSLMRHVIALLHGEDNDPESGLPHIGHIQCNAMFLAHFLGDKDWDNRYKKNDTQASIVDLGI